MDSPDRGAILAYNLLLVAEIAIPVLTSLRVSGSSIVGLQLYRSYFAALSLPLVGNLAFRERSLTNSLVHWGGSSLFRFQG